MLSARESRHILQLARDDTSSMRWLTDTESSSVAGTLQSVGTQDLETLHARFDFDSEVFTSRAYQVASRSNMIDALTGSRRNGISHNTEITGAPQGDTSGTSGPTSSQPSGTGIALTTVVDVISESDSDSESQSSLSRDTITEPQTSRTALVRGNDSDAQLPDFVVHPAEALGLLTLQFGESSSLLPCSLTSRVLDALPTTEKQTRGRLFDPHRRLSLRLRPKKQTTAPLAVGRIQAYTPVKILILGISESGKSTLAKTMRAGHGDFDVSWRERFRFTIVNNTIMSLKWLLLMADQTDTATHPWQQQGSRGAEAFAANVQVILKLKDDAFPETASVAKRVSAAARDLWDHPYIREVFKTSGTSELRIDPGSFWDLPLYLPDCAEQ